jgi:hypothetical protein
VADATSGAPDSFLSEWLKRNDKVISFVTHKKRGQEVSKEIRNVTSPTVNRACGELVSYAMVSWLIGVGVLWQFVIVDSFDSFGGSVTYSLHMDWMTCAGGSFG